jgi:Family of unknown function (DUF5996)
MAVRVRVLARVAVRRRVAAQCRPAALACAKMHPTGSDDDALLALPPPRVFDVVKSLDVQAGVWHTRQRIMAMMSEELWPALPYDDWKDTYATLHMWTQVVGKVALAQAPPINHSWAIALQLTARGLSTRMLTHGSRRFTVEFDFVDHTLAIRASDGATSTLTLAPRSVADFYREVMGLLRDMALPVKIWPVPVEIPEPIRFDEDTAHASYDRTHVSRFWQILLQSHRVLSGARSRFIGKSSPIHFFWGAFDLAFTRFSGRPAPPREGPAFMREAYSHEVISHGFWPGGASLPEPVYYAYAVPEPDGLKAAPVQPAAAFYHHELGEFILPYAAVQRDAAPEDVLRRFVDSTYEQAAHRAGWDRAALERPVPAPASR